MLGSSNDSLKATNTNTSNFDTFLGEVKDRETRTNNIVVFNLIESESQLIADRIKHDLSKLKNICINLGINDDSYYNDITLIRLGNTNSNKARPLLVKTKAPLFKKTVM